MGPKPEVQQLLDQLAQLSGPDVSELTVDEARAAYHTLYEMLPKPEIAHIDERTLPGPAGPIPIRIYTGDEAAAHEAPPVLVWFHGGGFVIGDLDTADNVARALANRSDAKVVSVGYRLAPEDPFPAPVDDAYAATAWVSDHADEIGADGSRLAVGGHSAGANLAAVVSQLARAAGTPAIQLQILACPTVDGVEQWPSRDENAEGYFLTRSTMDWFLANYVGGRDANNPRISPLRASDLSGLPPAVVITAELDPLRDEGRAYAAALAGAGVKVEPLHYDGQIHDFYTFEDVLPDARDALDRMAKALRSSLAS